MLPGGVTVSPAMVPHEKSEVSLPALSGGTADCDKGLRTEAPAGPAFSPELLARIPMTPQVDEPQRQWDLAIAGYLYLGGLGAGAFVIAVLLDWFGLGLGPVPVELVDGWPWDWSQALLWWGAPVTAVGASLLIFHLGRNWYLFHTAWKNPRTSWLARGFLILTAFIVVGTIIAAVAVLFPDWPARLPSLWRLAQGLGFVLAVGTAVYTGLLLRSMRYIAAWNTVLLPVLFLASALSTGVAGQLLGTLLYGVLATDQGPVESVVHALEGAKPALIALEAAALAAYVWRLTRGKPEAQESARRMLSGSWRTGFWLGIVGGALVLPLVLTGVGAALASDSLTITSAMSALIGGFILRMGVLAVGIREAPPLYRLSRWQAERGSAAAVLGGHVASRERQ